MFVESKLAVVMIKIGHFHTTMNGPFSHDSKSHLCAECTGIALNFPGPDPLRFVVGIACHSYDYHSQPPYSKTSSYATECTSYLAKYTPSLFSPSYLTRKKELYVPLHSFLPIAHINGQKRVYLHNSSFSGKSVAIMPLHSSAPAS